VAIDGAEIANHIKSTFPQPTDVPFRTRNRTSNLRALLARRRQEYIREASLNREEVNALKRIVLAFVLVLSLFTVTSFAAEMTGYISDSKCGAKGEKDAHADCAVKCVKGGASPVFVSDGKVYKIDDVTKVQDHVGHKVTITGELKGDTIQVQEVKM
jgi:hypothetical protein